uniref:Uncharacterized protein n=1 Tax=Daucus carota subsp. sativus TaxID=79200 RepID=A0A164Y777_DAUCS
MAFKLQNVIGVVENPGQVSTIRTINGDRRVHKFQVTDGHVFVRVTLLGSILDSSNVLFTANLQAPVVIVLAGVRIKRIPDIIGMIEEWETASRVPTRYREKETLRFKLSDGRFRLLVLADDNSFATTVVLTDHVVKRLAQTIVTNLMNSSKEAPISEMPPVLKNIAGKNVTVKISLSKSNVAGDSNIYKSVDLCEGSVSGKKDAEYSPITKFPSFEQSQTDDYVVCLETPTSSDSVSKKSIVFNPPFYDTLDLTR